MRTKEENIQNGSKKVSKTIMEMTKKDFDEVPRASWDTVLKNFNSLVIIPTKIKHDSGYMCMRFCAVDDRDMPIALLAGGSDVIHIDGICGYGKWDNLIPKSVPPKRWSIDCIPCGYLRLFATRNSLTNGPALSSFEIFSCGGEEQCKQK